MYLSPLHRVKRYAVIREEKHRFQGLFSPNTIETQFKVTHLKPLEGGGHRFKVERSNFRQSNASGMFKWAGDINSQLYKEMVVDISPLGLIADIWQYKVLNVLWHELKHDLKKKHREDRYRHHMIKNISKIMDDKALFIETIKHTYPYTLLFPHIYGKELGEDAETEGYRELNSLVGAKKLPIMSGEKLLGGNRADGAAEVVVSGRIDTEKFRQDHVTSMLKTLKNRPRVPTQVKLNYTERHLLDAGGSTVQGLCWALVQVPGSFTREEKTILRQLDPKP